MIHCYKLGGLNIVLDIFSGSVHVVDEVAYDMIEMYESCDRESIISAMLEKYAGREDVTREELEECLSQIEELKAEGKLYGHAEPYAIGTIYRASEQIVGDKGTAIDVFGIIFLAIVVGIALHGESRPLRMVARTLIVAGHAASVYGVRGSSANDGTATAEANGIGTYYARLLALVGENHHLVVALALLELEGAQVYPRATTHLLVDLDACGASCVNHDILSIGHARRVGLIGNIHGIVPALGDMGNP